ncbi:hypothetical protein HAX54_033624, partial [Datura stramonium]|nr:hypothetical protein [Datura stramonium]
TSDTPLCAVTLHAPPVWPFTLLKAPLYVCVVQAMANLHLHDANFYMFALSIP